MCKTALDKIVGADIKISKGELVEIKIENRSILPLRIKVAGDSRIISKIRNVKLKNLRTKRELLSKTLATREVALGPCFHQSSTFEALEIQQDLRIYHKFLVEQQHYVSSLV